MKNIDRLRTMANADLARFLLDVVITDAIPFCRCLPECEEDMEADRPIPESRCLECMEHWLGTEAT